VKAPKKAHREKLAQATVLLMILEFLTAVAGLGRQMVVAAKFGTSETTDAYVVAMTVLGLIQLWLLLPIRQVILPMFRYDLTRQGEKDAWGNASILINNLAVVLLLVTLVAWFLTPGLVSLLTPGFDASTNELAATLTRIALFSMVFVVPSTILEQILFSYERFFLPGITDLVNNVVTLIALFILGSAYGIYGLAAAVVCGGLCEFISQTPILWEKRKLYQRKIDLHHPGMHELGRLSFPLLFANSGVELARITDRIFASLLPAGSLSALSFAGRPTSILLDMFVSPLQKSIFPHFTRLSAEGDFQALSRQHSRYMGLLFFLTMPVAVGILVTAEPIVRMLYQRGAFDETSVRLTSQSLACYALGFPALALSRALIRTFVSLKDTWAPTKTSLWRIGVKILLSWLLVYRFAHIGLALAEALSQIFRTVYLFILLPKEVKGQEEWTTVKSFAQTTATCVLMGASVYFVREEISGFWSTPVELSTLVLIGVISYAALSFVRKGEELQSLLATLSSLGAKYLPRRS
jgi:putative peptidoglycan lipid II flippase